MMLHEFGIDVKGKTRGQVKVKCPKCSPDRKKKNDPCLSVNIDEGVWNCHNCGWAGNTQEKKTFYEKRIYIKPEVKPMSDLSQDVIKWFSTRGISEDTLVANKVSEGLEWMPQTQKEENTIQFNYYRGEELINVKYRDGRKNFKMVKDAEKILYGINDIEDSSSMVIVEGEIDKLSFWEAGVHSCVSVPNGGSGRDLEYLVGVPDDIETIYLAVDSDEVGRSLEKELGRRLGYDRCLRVRFPEGCKDANEVLIECGASALEECLKKAQPFPLEGVVNISDISVDIDDLYESGLERGETVGHKSFDHKFSFKTSQLTAVTGVPTHGKSNFLEHLCMRLSAQSGWKFGVFSPEHYPLQLHFSVLAEKFIGKSFRKDTHFPRISKDELQRAKDFIDSHYHFIRPDGDVFTIDGILDSAKQLIKRYGINALILDPYNKIHANMNGKSETQYINEFLTKLTIFKQKYDIHIFLVAHPRKMGKDENGLYDVPTLYDIAGSANFYNQVDNGITVYRDFSNDTTRAYIQKVKFRHIGEIGYVDFRYNLQNGRYYELDENPDNQPYINNQTTLY